jgi:hypothetical protein
MPGGSKKAADVALIAHLADGVSPAGAAKLAGVSEATAYRRLANSDFRHRVEKARADFWDRALGVMWKGAAESAPLLRGLCPSCGLQRLGANTRVIVKGVSIDNREAAELFGLTRREEQCQHEQKSPS